MQELEPIEDCMHNPTLCTECGDEAIISCPNCLRALCGDCGAVTCGNGCRAWLCATCCSVIDGIEICNDCVAEVMQERQELDLHDRILHKISEEIAALQRRHGQEALSLIEIAAHFMKMGAREMRSHLATRAKEDLYGDLFHDIIRDAHLEIETWEVNG